MKRFYQYVKDVLSGKRVAGELEILAVKRHVKDLENPKFIWDEKEAQRVIDLHDNFVLYEGSRAGQKMSLEPFQVFIVGSVWGWWWADSGTRRYQWIFELVGRKNAKSMRMAATNIIATKYDFENAPQNYCIAINHEQAYKSFQKAHKLARKTGLLDGRRFRNPNARVVKPRALVALTLEDGKYYDDGFYEPLANVPDAQEGLNPYLTTVEEFHVHKTERFYNVMEEAMGSRPNQMIWIITTAGEDLDGPCYQQYLMYCKMLRGESEIDESCFIIIFEMNKGDDWLDERNWGKANPGIGVTKFIANMRNLLFKARKSPSKKIEFRRKQLSVWGESADQFFTEEAITANFGEPIDLELLRGKICSAAVDAGNTRDLTTYTLIFKNPFGDGRNVMVTRAYTPEAATDEEWQNEDRYRRWSEEGFLTITPGAMSDNAILIDDMVADKEELGFKIHQVRYDVRFFKDAAIKLGDRLYGGRKNKNPKYPGMIQVTQNYSYYNEPIDTFEKMICKTDPKDINKIVGQYNMLGNKVARWCMRNFRTKKLGDLKMPEKPEHVMSPKKIDVMVAALMAHEGLADLPKVSTGKVWTGDY